MAMKSCVVTLHRDTLFSGQEKRFMEVWPGHIRLFEIDFTHQVGENDDLEAQKLSLRIYKCSKRFALTQATITPQTESILISIHKKKSSKRFARNFRIAVSPTRSQMEQLDMWQEDWIQVLKAAQQMPLEDPEDENQRLWRELDSLTTKLEGRDTNLDANTESVLRASRFVLAQSSLKIFQSKRELKYVPSSEAYFVTTGRREVPSAPKVVLLGSINMDLVAETAKVGGDLLQGKNVVGKRFSFMHGGKGANEAVALSRLGIDVTMVGRVGKDEFGTMMLTQLQHEGVEATYVTRHQKSSTGVAVIIKGQEDKQKITIGCSGANSEASAHDVANLMKTSKAGLVLQLEVPLSVCETAAKFAKSNDRPVFLKASPLINADGISENLLRHLDVLFCNETEALVIAHLCAKKFNEGQTAATAVATDTTTTETAASSKRKGGSQKAVPVRRGSGISRGKTVAHLRRGKVPLRDKSILKKPRVSNIAEAFDVALCIMTWIPSLTTVVVSSNAGHVCLSRKAPIEDEIMYDMVSDSLVDPVANYHIAVMPFMEANSVDLIGAADCLFSGFVAAHLLDLPTYLRLVWAQTCACLSTMGKGAQESCPTMNNLARGITEFANGATKWAPEDALPGWGSEEATKIAFLVLVGENNKLAPSLVRLACAASSPNSNLSDAATRGLVANFINTITDCQGISLLHLAVLTANPESCRALLRLGADPLLKDKFGFTPLQRAVVLSKNPSISDASLVVELLVAACIIKAPSTYAEDKSSTVTRMFEPILVPPPEPFQSQQPFSPQNLAQYHHDSRQPPFAKWTEYRKKSAVLYFVDLPNPTEAPPSLEVLELARIETIRGGLANGWPAIREYVAESLALLISKLSPEEAKKSLLDYEFKPPQNVPEIPSTVTSCVTNLEKGAQNKFTSTILSHTSQPANVLCAAAWAKHIALLRVLRPHLDYLAFGASTEHKRTPLHFAAMTGDVGVCLEVMRWGYDVDIVDESKITPLELLDAEEKRSELLRHGRIRDVFISYSHKDLSAPFAAMLRNELVKNKVTVWIDHEIKGGEEWRNAIGKAVSSSKIVIVIVADKWAESGWCVGELKLARDKAKPILFLFPPHLNARVTMESILGLESLQEALNRLEILDSADYRVNVDSAFQIPQEDFARITKITSEKLLEKIQALEAAEEADSAEHTFKIAAPRTVQALAAARAILTSYNIDINHILEQSAPDEKELVVPAVFVTVLFAQSHSVVAQAVGQSLGETHKLSVVLLNPKCDVPDAQKIFHACKVAIVVLEPQMQSDGLNWLGEVLGSSQDGLPKVVVLPFSPTPNTTEAVQYAFGAVSQFTTTRSIVPWAGPDGAWKHNVLLDDMLAHIAANLKGEGA